jgi:hypothetical protein
VWARGALLDALDRADAADRRILCQQAGEAQPMNGRAFEAAKSGFAAVGLLFAAAVVSGGVTPIEPDAGWALFGSGALWIGLPLIVAVNRYRK